MKPGVAIVCGVHHVQLSFPARAQAAMERFYGEVLGLSALTVAGRPGLSFLAGGQRIDLVPYKGQSGGTERAAGNLVHLALTSRAADCRVASRSASSHGKGSCGPGGVSATAPGSGRSSA